MKKICILTQSHLCRNPRVVKEANTLVRAGFEVVILTTFISAELLEEDKKLIDLEQIEYIDAVNIISDQTKKIQKLSTRLQRRIAMELVEKFRIESPYALGYGYSKYLQAALNINPDLYIAHQEMPTYVGCELLKLKRKVAFDLEDWYSVLLPTTEQNRPIKLLKTIEATALTKGSFCLTTSDVMGREMARFYQSPAPVTLYNSFPWEERSKIERNFSDRKDISKPSLIWFSQTIGPGRGLELLIEALRLVESPVELHLRGNCNQAYQTRLKSFFPYNKNHQLYIHPLVSNEQLISRIAEHDIGLALEQQEPLGRNLTITNKILQYLLAGVAVIAATTKGQKEVADKASDAVFLVKNGDAAQLAEKIDFLIKDKTVLAKAKIAALNVAQNYFCWEKQEIVLLQQVEKCFAELTLT